MPPQSTTSTLIPPPVQINDAHKVYGVTAGLLVLGISSTLFSLLRLWYRFSTRTYGLDDYASIPALLLYILWTTMAVYVNLHAGVGKPLWEITVGEFAVWFKGILGSAWLYPIMSASIRVSILLLYLRVFGITVPRFRYMIWGLLALQAVYVIVYSILPVFIAKPLRMIWHPLERHLYMNDWYYYYTQVALYSTSMAFDAILLFLPIYPVSQLQMTRKKRAGVLAIFMLGACASIAAAYKLAIFVTQMARYTHINPTWLSYEMSMLIPPQFDVYGTTFWIPAQVEPSVALIGASLPGIRPIILHASDRVSVAWCSIRRPSNFSSGNSSSTRSRKPQWNDQASHEPQPRLLDRDASAGEYYELRERGNMTRSTDSDSEKVVPVGGAR